MTDRPEEHADDSQPIEGDAVAADDDSFGVEPAIEDDVEADGEEYDAGGDPGDSGEDVVDGSDLAAISTTRSEKRAGDADSDSAAIPDEPEGAAASKPSALRDWSGETSSRAVAVELKRIESEVRAILQDRDPRRKRKLAGTHRWEELEEDLLSWQFTGPIDDATNKQLRLLVRRRHYLFNRLRFLARTRPTWNS